MHQGSTEALAEQQLCLNIAQAMNSFFKAPNHQRLVSCKVSGVTMSRKESPQGSTEISYIGETLQGDTIKWEKNSDNFSTTTYYRKPSCDQYPGLTITIVMHLKKIESKVIETMLLGHDGSVQSIKKTEIHYNHDGSEGSYVETEQSFNDSGNDSGSYTKKTTTYDSSLRTDPIVKYE